MFLTGYNYLRKGIEFAKNPAVWYTLTLVFKEIFDLNLLRLLQEDIRYSGDGKNFSVFTDF